VKVTFGADRLVRTPALLRSAARLGLVTNDSARLSAEPGVRSRRALLDAGLPVVRLFGPEHGIGAADADGAAVSDATDALTGLPVVSLYGERMRPSRESIADLDAVLFDIPDVGARFYTYVWTLFEVLGACAEFGVPLVVLDRPNPLGGVLAQAEGPMLDLACASFIGGDAIPVRHSLTVGELARLWHAERHAERHAGSRLTVVECEGWRRELLWPQTGLPFVPTSPSMPSFASALLYPGICLFEATNVSVGRGTELAFQRIGAPWLDTGAVLERLSQTTPRGVRFEADEFSPAIGVYAGETMPGIRIEVTDERVLRPVALGILLLAAVITTHRLRFAWWKYPTAANPSGDGHFERLIGTRGVRARLDVSPETVDETQVSKWTRAEGWAERVGAALLYQ
jgi:uncharacterized protein YbbC (DUF1343 family)